uniref:Exostosin GT47 domain-containing protein n=1 Tax=Alexandrium monilatum TaxID=311494 RepID=A0A6T1A6P1_9DINO|mmetsp:Transcript_21247/g.63822  ORF Transcript_21247/g.63822 Transcript_21247/m.63822 type:complete len:458 (+) Transcript_21247:107-1480(+)
MTRQALRAVAALLLAAVALHVWSKLGRPKSTPRRDLVTFPRHRGTWVGASDGQFFRAMKAADKDTRNRYFKEWSEGMAWHAPYRHLPHIPTLQCEPGYSVLMSRFDWQIVPESAMNVGKSDEKAHAGVRGCRPVDEMPWKANATDIADPRTVWAAAHGVERLLQLAEARLDSGRNDRTVVFAGTEMPLSRAFGTTPAERNTTVAQLRRYFSRIVFVIKDIELEHVHAGPLGFCWGYNLLVFPKWLKSAKHNRSLLAGRFSQIDDLFTTTTISDKTKGILATGAIVATWLQDVEEVNQISKLRKDRGLDTWPQSNSSMEAVLRAAGSRKEAREWANTSAARAAGVEFRTVPAVVWLPELAQYRFLVSPIGSALQSSKTLEALAVLTVPIIARMGYAVHDELVAIGFPLVVIEGWSEITAASAETWWRELSPRLESFRRNCLTVDGYWRMFTGQVTYCT